MAEPALPLIDSVISVLETRGPTRWRQASNGERWLDCLCPFHADQNLGNAGLQPQTGVFHCFACGRTASLLELAQTLLVQGGDRPSLTTTPFAPVLPKTPPAANPPGGAPSLSVIDGAVPETVTAEYWYNFPDGTPSHLVRRMENANGKKRFLQMHADGSFGLPQEHWPIFEPAVIQKGSLLYIVEGEKCVLAINAAMVPQSQPPIAALSWVGGANRAQMYAQIIARRIKELEPEWVMLWPDNDDPGRTAMMHIARAMKQLAMDCVIVDPVELGLPSKGDVVDFLAANGSLFDLFQRHRGQDESVLAFAATIKSLPDGYFVFPGTRTPVKVDPQTVDAAWQTVNKRLPSTRQNRDLRAQLTTASITRPLIPHHRFAATADGFFWRPTRDGKCFSISKGGIGVGDDPPGSIILLPSATPTYPSGYEPGSVEDFVELVNTFQIHPSDADLLEGWLIATFLGLQTPILLLKGPAGSGKTTLAKALLAVIEPTIPELDATSDMAKDRRELVRSLEYFNALLIDNVSSLSRNVEDHLSKLVTDTTYLLRPLYGESVSMIRMHRTLVMTTITWDMKKSDLLSRTVVVGTQARTQWDADQEMRSKINGWTDRIRGYIWSRCVEFYRQPERRSTKKTLRVGDLGLVFDRLGFDVDAIAKRMRSERVLLAAQNDSWWDALINFWNEKGPGLYLGREVVAYVEKETGKAGQISPESLGRYIAEKAEAFKDYGFVIDRNNRTAAGKQYRFITAELVPEQEELNAELSPQPGT